MNKLKLVIAFLFSGLILNAQDCENDTINPYFVGLISDTTLNCSDNIPSFFPQAFDNCDAFVDIELTEEQIPGDCPQDVTYIRIYRAYDDSGNEIVESQIIHIVDTMGPTFSSSGETIVLYCGSEVTPPTPSVTDCNLTKLIGIDEGGSGDYCDFRLNRVWYAYDGCDNVSSYIQTIIYIDTIPPSIIAEPYIEVESNQNLDTIFASAIDACSLTNMLYTDNIAPSGDVIRIYRAFDNCGNQSIFEQIIHIHEDEDEDEDDDNGHVTICHHLGNGNWITLHVAPQAVPAHLAHGDYLGPCDENIENTMLPGMRLERSADGEIHKIVKMK